MTPTEKKVGRDKKLPTFSSYNEQIQMSDW